MKRDLSTDDRLKLGPVGEMEFFRSAELWREGYFDGDPLEPVGWSSYTVTGYVSVYHAVYLACIKPYVNSRSCVLEIGPGRGAWSKAILLSGAHKLYALDVQSRQTNAIDAHLGTLADRMEYIEVTDFSGEGVPDDAVDFFWSFGTFVHLSRLQQEMYIATIARKMRAGAQGFIQLADLHSWNEVTQNPRYHVHEVLLNQYDDEQARQLREGLKSRPHILAREAVAEEILHYDVPDPGRYFYVGLEWIAKTLEGAGLEVVEANVLPSLRDPLIHFCKPSSEKNR